MFKKFLVVIISVLCLANTYLANAQPIFKGYADNFELYVGGENTITILNVNEKFYPLVFNVRGESFKTEAAEFDLDEFLLQFDARVLFTEEIEQGVSYYAYSSKIPYRRLVLGQTVNLHVFVGKQITVGSPLIYGSF